MFLKGYRFLGGPYRFTGFCCIWHHHEILVCSDIKNCMQEAMEIADKKEDESSFVILKAWSSRRLVHGKEMVWASSRSVLRWVTFTT